MARRVIDTDFSNRPEVRAMKAPYKLLWSYLNCACDHAGIWVVELDVAALRLGVKLDREEALSQFGALVENYGGRWLVTTFVEDQYGELNAANKVHASVLQRLEALKKEAPTKPLGSPLQGAKDKDMEKAMELDKDEAMVKELGRGEGETIDAEIEPTFSQWWTLYDKSRDKAACQAKWKTIPHETHVAIMEHTRAYLVAQPDKLYRKDPIRYLTKQSWTDEIVTKHQPTQQDKQAELDRIAFERYGPPQNG